MKRMTQLACMLAAGTSFGAFGATAPLYDDFSGTEIDRGKWMQTESWLYTTNGKAKLGRWLYGAIGSDSGTTLESFNLNLTAYAPPKAFGATIKVTDIETNEGCAFNTSPSRPRARIIAGYFNVRPGGPVPGDRTGDVLAVAQLTRASDSTDPPGTLQVQGAVVECTNVDCTSSSVLYFAPLGTAMAGTAVALQIDWVKKSNLFRFTRDKTMVVETPYTEADGTPPALEFANLSLRNETANCASGARAKAGIAAEFDNVRLAP